MSVEQRPRADVVVVTELDSPFDDVDGPTTVATPSCCCCCCCCVATVLSATAMSARVVRRDGIDTGAASGGYHALLVGLAVFVPIAALWVTWKVRDDADAAAGVLVAVVAAALLLSLRFAAGARGWGFVGVTLAMAIGYPLALLIEAVLVLASVGLFWLTVPIWVGWAWVATEANGRISSIPRERSKVRRST